MSCGEVVFFLDSDDTLLPTAVENALKLLLNPNVVKVHWPVWEVNEHGRKTGRVFPGQIPPEGNLRDVVTSDGPDAHTTAAIHGNAFSRRFLERVFPMPEEFKNYADIYPMTLASIFGTTKRRSFRNECG